MNTRIRALEEALEEIIDITHLRKESVKHDTCYEKIYCIARDALAIPLNL